MCFTKSHMIYGVCYNTNYKESGEPTVPPHPLPQNMHYSLTNIIPATYRFILTYGSPLREGVRGQRSLRDLNLMALKGQLREP
jgi:hypothetical protein